MSGSKSFCPTKKHLPPVLLSHSLVLGRVPSDPLVDGLWLELLAAPRQLKRERAHKIASSFLNNLFPQHIVL